MDKPSNIIYYDPKNKTNTTVKYHAKGNAVNMSETLACFYK